jgi:hypothetical protein
VLGRVRFIDGNMPAYDRTYIVVSVAPDHIKLLNVSSTKGKEHKLLFPYNEELKTYDPPFLKPSFIKLDSLVSVPESEWENLKILHGGACLDTVELNRIIHMIP